MGVEATPRQSWLLPLFTLLLVTCGLGLIVTFWETLNSPAEPPNAGAEVEGLSLSDEEALQVLADPDTSSLARGKASDIVSTGRYVPAASD